VGFGRKGAQNPTKSPRVGEILPQTVRNGRNVENRTECQECEINPRLGLKDKGFCPEHS